jgi:hypothetical protein
MLCILCCVYYVVYIMLCILCCVYYVVYIMLCILCCVYYVVYIMLCILYYVRQRKAVTRAMRLVSIFIGTFCIG